MKQRRLSLLVAIALVVTPLTLSAQTSDDDPTLWQQFKQWRQERIETTDTYRASENGVTYTPIQDTRMTDTVYRTVGTATTMETRNYRPKSFSQTLFYFHVAVPAEEQFLMFDETWISTIGVIQYAYLRHLSDLPVSIGGSTSLTGHLRLYDHLENSSLNGDTIIDLGATARYEGTFTLRDRPATWHVQTTLPLIGYIARTPEYNIGGMQTLWGFPWNTPRIRLSAGFSRLLTHSEENRWNLNYRYDFYGITSDYDHLTVGSHSLTFGYSLKTM